MISRYNYEIMEYHINKDIPLLELRPSFTQRIKNFASRLLPASNSTSIEQIQLKQRVKKLTDILLPLNSFTPVDKKEIEAFFIEHNLPIRQDLIDAFSKYGGNPTHLAYPGLKFSFNLFKEKALHDIPPCCLFFGRYSPEIMIIQLSTGKIFERCFDDKGNPIKGRLLWDSVEDFLFSVSLSFFEKIGSIIESYVDYDDLQILLEEIKTFKLPGYYGAYYNYYLKDNTLYTIRNVSSDVDGNVMKYQINEGLF